MPVKVKFIRDFQGRASGEQFFAAGTVVKLPNQKVRMLLAEGVVERYRPAEVPHVGPAVVLSPPTAVPAPVDLRDPEAEWPEQEWPVYEPPKKKATRKRASRKAAR